MVGVNAKHSTLATSLLIAGLLVPNGVRAQDAPRAAPSQFPAKSNELISTLEVSAAAYRSGGSMTQAFSSNNTATEACAYCRGRLIEAFLRWTDRLVTKLDPIGVVDTPFEPSTRDAVRLVNTAQQPWRPVPRVRPIQLHGGYGLVARITF